MTLGRWLDMRGIQVSSYPAKSRNSVARSKRPLDVGKGMVSAAPHGICSKGWAQLVLGCAVAAAGDDSTSMCSVCCVMGGHSWEDTAEVKGLVHCSCCGLDSSRLVVVRILGACFIACSSAAVPAAVFLLRPAVCSYLQVAVLARVAAQVQLSS
jgi:hypothetical protein